MPEKIGIAAVADMTSFNRGLKEYTAGISEMNKKTETGASQMTTAIAGVGKYVGTALVAGIGLATAAIGAMGAAMFKLAADAAPLAGVKAAFEGITAASGVAADEMLAALKESSAGMVTNAEAMKSYNQAAQLVGVQFANELPNAMKYLTKVSAATGESMDYMMTSLVRGVGRLSPMILDNLGIQVDLTKAYEDHAAQMGITVKEMSKAEQQTALMNQVMVLLQQNTANMPEVAGTAAASMAALKAQLQDTKDEIGLALLPAFNALMGILSKLTGEYLPLLVSAFEEHVVPAVEAAVAWLGESIPVAIEAAGDAIQWFRDHIEAIKPVLVGLGTALAVAFGIWAASAAAAAATTLAATWPLLALGAAVATFYAAWTSDWGGVRTFLQDTWNLYLGPIFETIANWLRVAIPESIAIMLEGWETLRLGFEVVVNYANTQLLPMFVNLYDWLAVHIPKAVKESDDWFNKHFGPTLERVRNFINNEVIPAIARLYLLLGMDLPTATDKATKALQRFLYSMGIYVDLIDHAGVPATGSMIESLLVFGAVSKNATGSMGDMAEGLSFFTERVGDAVEGLHLFTKAIVTEALPATVSFAEAMGATTPEAAQAAKASVSDLIDQFSVDLPKAAGETKGMLREIAAALQELAEDWVPRLAEVFGVRMREMFEDAQNIRGELEELFGMAGVFAGLGGAAARMLEARTIGPLEDMLETARDALAGIEGQIAAIEERGFAGGVADIWEYNRLLEEREAISGEIAGHAADIAEHEARIVALQERQMELGFLQQQVNLLKLIEDYDLNLEDILGGMELGIEANAGDVLDAMVRAMEEVINVVEEELGIESPSKIFQRLGQEAMAGFTRGIHDIAVVPINALVQGVAQATAPAFARPSVTMPAAAVGPSFAAQFGPTTIHGTMDMAMLEGTVKQWVTEAMGA